MVCAYIMFTYGDEESDIRHGAVIFGMLREKVGLKIWYVGMYGH